MEGQQGLVLFDRPTDEAGRYTCTVCGWHGTRKNPLSMLGPKATLGPRKKKRTDEDVAHQRLKASRAQSEKRRKVSGTDMT